MLESQSDPTTYNLFMSSVSSTDTESLRVALDRVYSGTSTPSTAGLRCRALAELAYESEHYAESLYWARAWTHVDLSYLPHRLMALAAAHFLNLEAMEHAYVQLATLSCPDVTLTMIEILKRSISGHETEALSLARTTFTPLSAAHIEREPALVSVLTDVAILTGDVPPAVELADEVATAPWSA